MKIFLKIFITLSFSHILLLGHCQIPCGIYSDAVQIIQINEHLATIEKSIGMIKKHQKPTKENKGGIISKESFIHLSNIKNLDAKKKEKKIAGKK